MRFAVIAGAAIAMPATVHAAPGVPVPPTTVYTEDFENVPDATKAYALDAYTGASGMTYSADPGWLPGGSTCNGIVVSGATTDANGNVCGFYAQIKSLGNVLGSVNGSSPTQDNQVLSAYTSNNPGVDAVQFETGSPIPLVSSGGRFITFSVNAAAINCQAPGGGPVGRRGAPLFKFYLLDPASPGSEIATFTDPIVPCAPGASSGAGSFPSDSAVLFNGPSLGLRMRNGNGNGGGNDAAIDDIKVLDATPSLDKSFTPDHVLTNEVSTLKFTVTNTSELAAKPGWSFSDALPGAVRVAGAATTTCSNGSLNAPVGGASIAVSGDLTTGQSSCEVSVPVSAATAGTYVNGPSNVTSTGLNPVPPATLTVTSPDTAPPECTFVKQGVGLDLRAYMDVRARDPLSGIQSIVVHSTNNANVPIPAFTPGTTDWITVRGYGVVPLMPATFFIRVTDMAGNVTICDPVATVLRNGRGGRATRVIKRLPRDDRWVRISNGRPGVRTVELTVNGKRFRVGGLRAGAERKLDIRRALKSRNNRVVVRTQGPRGAIALVSFADM
ncbi:DUF7933 domain-containing protein [Patulibacter defluvii]|uniref:DUF7933 domain-containing protein n=1 Tax=Patulibacter defluvii TaxID=3095358 RepID=UPI002A74D243|nr:hypothetical protein [Patulibacter sp. DM4]